MSRTGYSRQLTFSGKNRMEFSLCGGRILMIKIQGGISESFIERFVEERRNFIKEIGLKSQEFIEIRRFTHSRRMTRKLIQLIKKEINDNASHEDIYPLASYYVNLSYYIRFIRSLQSQNRNTPFISEICKNQREALIRGINLLYERGFYSFAGKSRIKNREWFFENPNYRESIQMLANDTIYAECKGALSNQGEPQRRELWEYLINENSVMKNGFTLILGLKEHDFEQRDIDNILSPYWLDLLQRDHCRRILVISNQDSIAVAVNQTLTLNPLSFKIERRFEDALLQVFPRDEGEKSRKKQNNRGESGEDLSQELEKLENYLLSLDIKKPVGNQLIPSETLAGQDPFRPIYQAVNLFYSQVQDEYTQIQLQWQDLSKRNKEALLLQGIYEILYRDRSREIVLEHCIVEIVELFNEVMTDSRASVFVPEGKTFLCVKSKAKNRPSLKGVVLPSSIMEYIESKPVREFHLRDLSQRMNHREKLTHGPFLQSFLQSQGINMILIRPMLQDDNPRVILLIDFSDETSPETDYMAHLLNQVVYLLKNHFGTEKATRPPPVNRDEALSEYDNDQEFFTQVLGSFIENLKTQMPEMKKALSDEDHDQLRREAHKIKGGAANLFAKDLQMAALHLEEQASAKEIDQYRKALDQLNVEMERLEVWFRKEWK